jgi:hypothetical protein
VLRSARHPHQRLLDGVRTFDSINESLARITGVSPTNARVQSTYANVRQSLPAINDIPAFLSSHQTSIAQLALQYCSSLVDDATARASFFPGVNFGTLNLADVNGRNSIIDPIVDKSIGAVGTATTQPEAEARAELHALITTKLCASTCSPTRALDVTKAVCGAALGSAATLVQ